MVDLILLSSYAGMLYAGFWLGARYGTLKAATAALVKWLESFTS